MPKNSAENGNRLGVWRVSVAGLAAAGGGAVPVFGNGAGTGSGTFSLTAGLATAQHVAKIVTTIAATILQHRPIAVRRILGAIAIRPDLAGRFGAIIPSPPDALCTHALPETTLAKCALWQIRD